jgi:hypothetical protein
MRKSLLLIRFLGLRRFMLGWLALFIFRRIRSRRAQARQAA